MFPVADISNQRFVDVFNIVPKLSDIPKEFHYYLIASGKWNKLVNNWFFKGLPRGTKFIPKPDVDEDKAVSHVCYVLQSFDLSHEHKMAAAAYLMSQWFEDVVLPK